MCHRMSPLLFEELAEALRELRATGRARVSQRNPGVTVPDAYPGSEVPLFVPDENGDLVAANLTWGFPTQRDGQRRLVFNTRIETALSQGAAGQGLWADAIRYGRCLVPVRSFYERWTQPLPQPDTAESSAGGMQGAEVSFGLAGHRFMLLACVCNEDRFSVVTTMPNAAVAPIHNRMPLVLGPGESAIWLGPDYASLQDRTSIRLVSHVEQPQPQR